MKKIKKNNLHSQQGSVIVFFALVFAVTAAIAALVVDAGNGYMQQRNMQQATDAAALAAVQKFAEAAPNDAYGEAVLLANENGVQNTELALTSAVEIGTWDHNTKVFTAFADPQNLTVLEQSTANAVSVSARRTMPARFASMIGFTALQTSIRSIAFLPTITKTKCLKPFGVETSGLNAEFGSLDNIMWGVDTFTVGSTGPGNWGKMDLGGNMSSGNNFDEKMQSGVCDLIPAPFVGMTLDPATGYGGPLGTIFDSLYISPDPEDKHMLLALVSDFPNGNSGDITIEGFLEVTINALTLSNGNNWTMELLLQGKHDDVNAVTYTTLGDRTLVY